MPTREPGARPAPYVREVMAGFQGRRVRAAVAVSVVALLSAPFALGTPAHGAVPTATIQAQGVAEVQTIDTTELGVTHPGGVAYDRAANALVVAAAANGTTAIAKVTPTGDALGSSVLPAADPSTLAVNPSSGDASLLAGPDQVLAPASQLS